jgi:hypothetical protein
VKNKQNLIKNNYLSSKTNHAICIAITDLGQNGELFVGIHIAALLVIMHCYKKEPLNVEDIIQTLEMTIKHRAFLPNIKRIHSEYLLGGLFLKTCLIKALLRKRTLKLAEAPLKVTRTK